MHACASEYSLPTCSASWLPCKQRCLRCPTISPNDVYSSQYLLYRAPTSHTFLHAFVLFTSIPTSHYFPRSRFISAAHATSAYSRPVMLSNHSHHSSKVDATQPACICSCSADTKHHTVGWRERRSVSSAHWTSVHVVGAGLTERARDCTLSLRGVSNTSSSSDAGEAE